MYTVPSSNPISKENGTVAIPTTLRDSLSFLDAVWSNMFETEDINPEEARKHEADFLKGAPPKWLNIVEEENSLLVKRDGFNRLIQLIERKKIKHCLVTDVSLQYYPGSGGSTLTMQVLWHFRKDLRCARVITSDLDTKKLSKHVVDLFLLSNEEHAEQDRKTVLLLLDTKEKINDLPIKNVLWKDLIEEIHRRGINTETPVVIILNCIPKDFTLNDASGVVKLKMELLPEEKERFAQKMLGIEQKKMSPKFHAFNIMQGGFKKEDAEKVITKEMIKHVEKDIKSSSTILLSFLALINAYVPGSHLSKLLCEKFIGQTQRPTVGEKPSLEMIMKPFMDLIVIFSEGEQKADCIRLAHPMIADACLKMFTEHKLTRFDIALNILNSLVKGEESIYRQICKRMLVKRPDTEKDRFSKLILHIMKKRGNNHKQCIHLLELAVNLFSTDPFFLQALARFYYIEVRQENKYIKAEKWAKMAIEKDSKNSYLRDTLGQIHKNHLSWIWKESVKQWMKVENPWTNTKVCLPIAQSAIKAFKDEEKAAEDEAEDKTTFNYRGLFGFLQVCKIIHPKTPLKHSDQEYSKFITGLKGAVETKYDFFEWFLAFSKVRFKKDYPAYISEDVEECYMHYFKQREQTGETTLNEKKIKSFGGLLNFLKSNINVLKENQSGLKNPQSEHETVLYILANIILSQSGEACEKAEDLQARLQKLWATEAQDRSPEFYLLILLLFWPDEAQPVIANPPDLEKCVQHLSKSYERKYQKYLRGRYLVPLFFLGKGKGLQRLKFFSEGYEKAKVKCLQLINGKVKNHKLFAVIKGKQIQVTPHNRASVYKQGLVSFYLGFNIREPVAYNIRYEENCK